jgi:hypothetical protein
MEVIEGNFNNSITLTHKLQDDILDVLDEYRGKITVAAVLGVFEVIKFDLLTDEGN